MRTLNCIFVTGNKKKHYEFCTLTNLRDYLYGTLTPDK